VADKPRTAWRTERARLAAAVRLNRPDEADVARRRMHALRADERIREILAEAPPFTDSQRDALAALFQARPQAASRAGDSTAAAS
jgi:hypothetical protein